MDYSLSCCQIYPFSLYIFYSLVLQPVSEIFHAHCRNYAVLVEKAYLSVCFTFCLSFYTMVVKLQLTLVSVSPNFIFILCAILLARGTRLRSWLRHCATSQKVAGLIPDGVTGIFH